MTKYRLSWKGVLFSSEALLYANPDTPQILLIPILFLLYLPKLFLSYLKISKDGIELYYWPNYRLKTSWNEINRLGKVSYFGKFTHDALFIHDTSGKLVNTDLNRQIGIRKKIIIPLSDFRGWPGEDLINELVKHKPDIMKSKNNTLGT